MTVSLQVRSQSCVVGQIMLAKYQPFRDLDFKVEVIRNFEVILNLAMGLKGCLERVKNGQNACHKVCSHSITDTWL